MTAAATTRIVTSMTPTVGHPSAVEASGRQEGIRVAAAEYEIRIRGRVGDSVLLAFEELTATTEPAETILYGSIPDQEALHRLLGKLQSLGLEVVEFRQLPGSARQPGEQAQPPP